MYTDYPGYGSLHRREFIVYLRKYNRPVSDRHLHQTRKYSIDL